ncbi:MAG: VOC family protein [Pseudomonadota bacterium]
MVNVSISIDVPGLNDWEAFYCGALGCKLIENGTEGIRILDAGNVRLYLLERVEGSIPFEGSRSGRSYDRHWSPIHLDFGTKEIAALESLVEQHGGAIEGRDTGDWGSIAYCVDPFGNGFCLIDE